MVNMKQKLSFIVAFAFLLAVFSGCSSVQKVISTGDYDLIFDRGIVYYEAGKWTKALALFENCEGYYKGTTKEDTVAFYRARCYFKDHDYVTASELFDEFRRTFNRSAFLEQAEAMYAICLYDMCPDPERDQSLTTNAIIAISEFMSHYPDSEQFVLFQDMANDLRWRLCEKAYLNAYTYYKIERYNSAIIAFRNALSKHPDSHRREDVMYYIVMSGYKLAANSVEEKQLERYMSMLDSYYSFIMEYPESKYKEDLDKCAEEAKLYIEKNKQEE